MQSKIERQVMASVAVVYAARILTGRTALKCYVLVLSVAGIAAFVSLPHVAENFAQVAHGGLPSISTFALAAVLQTKILVQLALAVGIAALGSLFVDMVRFSTTRQTLAA